MTPKEIIALVEAELEVPLSFTSNEKEYVQARHIAILMMHEEDYSHTRIGKELNINRTTVYYALGQADRKLSISGNKEFKRRYLRCIKRMADLEAQQ
ncbi:MAG: hypothetical protein WBP45_13185 [Daejeonella sp.]